MCGIIIVIDEEFRKPISLERLSCMIDKRGPDYQSQLNSYSARCGLKLRFKVSVLHLTGETIREQPVIDERGNVLLFNGQIYKFDGQELDSRCSDTSFLAEKLTACVSRDEIVEFLSLVDGPYAFIFWHNDLNCLIYARDLFGRKSLCKLTVDRGYPLIISSVCDQDVFVNKNPHFTWEEVQSGQVHCLQFTADGTFENEHLYLLNLDDIYQPTGKCPVRSAGPAQVFSGATGLKMIKPLNMLDEVNEVILPSLLNEFEGLLVEAITRRINHQWHRCLNCRTASSSTCSHSKIAVAFSGGIDSTIIALLLDKVFPKDETIDLLTVTFKSNSPDRFSAGIAFQELRKLCPTRRWKLVACDVSLERLQEERLQIIRHLVAPCKTVIDDSVGCACWFIGEGRGRILDHEPDTSVVAQFLEYKPKLTHDSTESEEYVCPATMLFVGSGIDEQLGGYSSHKIAWMKSGRQGLVEEISFLMRRISSRNMGRDDRVYSHHGRDVKIPFLDFELVSFLNELPVAVKMNLEEHPGIGPKKLLRSLAHRLGLEETSKQVKRAMQFGTRIANLEDSREKGNQVCKRLLNYDI